MLEILPSLLASVVHISQWAVATARCYQWIITAVLQTEAWTWRSTWRSTWKRGFNPARKYESQKISHTKSMIIIHHHPTYEGNTVLCQPATPIRFATFTNQFRSFRNRTKRSLSPPSYDKYDRPTWWPADNDLLSGDLSLLRSRSSKKCSTVPLCFPLSIYIISIYIIHWIILDQCTHQFPDVRETPVNRFPFVSFQWNLSKTGKQEPVPTQTNSQEKLLQLWRNVLLTL